MTEVAVVQYRVRPESAEENQRLIEQVFAELALKQPDGLRYASFRLDDGVTFMHIVMSEEGMDVLPQLAAFQKFSGTIADRIESQPVRSSLNILGSYRFLSVDESE